MAGKRIEKYRVETDAKVRGLDRFKSEGFEATEDVFHNLLFHQT